MTVFLYDFTGKTEEEVRMAPQSLQLSSHCHNTSTVDQVGEVGSSPTEDTAASKHPQIH